MMERVTMRTMSINLIEPDHNIQIFLFFSACLLVFFPFYCPL